MGSEGRNYRGPGLATTEVLENCSVANIVPLFIKDCKDKWGNLT